MYSRLYQIGINHLYPGKTVRDSLKEAEASQWSPRSDRDDYFLARLVKLVQHAYENVPFYREFYKKAKIHPGDIKSLDDFQMLPCLTREDIIKNQNKLRASGFADPVFEGATSGSTGTPMQFAMEKKAIWRAFAFNAVCRGWYGVQPGDKRAFITATVQNFDDWSWKEKLASHIKRYRYLNVLGMTRKKMESFARMLVEWKPDMIRAYPSSLALFAKYLKENRIKGITPKLVEVTAEKVTPDQRALFEEVFHAPVADHYASLEIYSYAYQCPRGGLHVNADRYIEVTEKEKSVARGQVGEVVVTALNQYAMPFIRYKNGDVAILDTKDCPCGRSWPVIREVIGRNCDLLVHSNGRIVHWSSVIVIMMNKTEVRNYQLCQTDRKHVEVRLVLKREVDRSYLDDIRRPVENLFGDKVDVSIKVLDDIPLTRGGKYRFIMSDVTPEVMAVDRQNTNV